MKTARQLQREADITARQFDHWMTSGYLQDATKRAQPGSGNRHLMEDVEVEVARALRTLLGLNAASVMAKALAKRVRSGKKGKVRVARGVYFDLDEICKPDFVVVETDG